MCPDPRSPLCVFCRRKAVVHQWRPFCSERCKIRDLANWADQSYRVVGAPTDDDDDTADPAPERSH